MGAAIRLPFRKTDEPDAEAPEQDPEEQISKVIHEHDLNQLFVAFTATPAPATVTLFGQPSDTYSEAEAIAEGYIVDVAISIISYKTLYNLHCHVVPKQDEEKLYPKGVVAKALKNVAFQDDGLIQYKAEVMLRIFEQDVMRCRIAVLPDHQRKVERTRRALQGTVCIFGLRPPGNECIDQRTRRERIERRRADRGTV